MEAAKKRASLFDLSMTFVNEAEREPFLLMRTNIQSDVNQQ
jgi:hypothetical protein